MTRAFSRHVCMKPTMAWNAENMFGDCRRRREEAEPPRIFGLLVRFLSATSILKCVLIALLAFAIHDACAATSQTKNVFLITIDGLRWQEVFRGADPLLINKENGGVADTNRLNAAFWRNTPDARLAAL